MSPSQQIPLGKLGWLVLLAVVAAPVAFFFFVTPKESSDKPVPSAVKPLPSKLEAVGLRENPDWDGLPEIFAIWSGRAHWENDRTRFAYWHPGSRTYGYFFEARRTAGGFRFKEIPEPHDEGFEWDPQAPEDSPLRLYLPTEPELLHVRPPEKPVHESDLPVKKVPIEIPQPQAPSKPGG